MLLHPPNSFIETLAACHPQIEHLKIYAHMSTFSSENRPVLPCLKTLDLMTVVAAVNHDIEKDRLEVRSESFPRLEQLHINYIYLWAITVNLQKSPFYHYSKAMALYDISKTTNVY